MKKWVEKKLDVKKDDGFQASPPGGKRWGKLGNEHFLRDFETMKTKEAPLLLTNPPKSERPPNLRDPSNCMKTCR